MTKTQKLRSKYVYGGVILFIGLFIANLFITSLYAQDAKNSVQDTAVEAVAEKKAAENSTENSDAETGNKEGAEVTETTVAEAEKIDEKKELEGNSLFSTITSGDSAGDILMIFILFLGLGAMTIVIERIIYFTKHSVWKGQMLEEDLREKVKNTAAAFKEDLEDELTSFFTLYTTKMERGLALLSGIGNLAPIAGFLGTVIGMIGAFASIAAATTVNAKVVAVGIQTALITTAGGLVVAAPTLAFFYLFTHVIQNRHAHAEEIIAEVTADLPRLSVQLQDEQAENKKTK